MSGLALPDVPASILAATDLSEGALAAVGAGSVLAEAGATLHVLHVAEPGADAEELAAARTLLERQVRHVVPLERPVSLIVERGDPFRGITEVSGRLSADVVVVGSHRPRRAFDGLLGTTADRVLRTSGVPVLVLNGPFPELPTRILVATDLSPAADRALAVAASWAARWGDVLGGAAPPVLELVRVSAFAHPAYRPDIPTEALRSRAATAEAGCRGRVRVRPRVLAAPLAVEGIQRAAEELRAELVVLGTHGHTLLARALLGGVASEVARTLPYPVLLVPPAPGS